MARYRMTPRGVRNAAMITVVGGQVVARGGYVDPAGGFVASGGQVVCTAEGSTYGEVVSGETITVAGAGLATGDTGALQSNSRRYVASLAAIGVELTGSSPRMATIQLLCDSLGDNSEARAGTLALLAWLGVGSTTALDITGIQRPSSGSASYQEGRARTSATSLTTGTASTLNFGSALTHGFPSDDGTLLYGALTSTGAMRATGTQSGGAISASTPTHLVMALRASAGASGAVFIAPRVVVTFSSAVADI